MSEDLKKQAAEAAMDLVEPGMLLGLGTGSTADFFLQLLAEAVAEGLDVRGVPTSERTMKIATSGGIPLVSLDDEPHLDLTIDGADEVDRELRLIKGGGGALLREKIVAAASERMVVIADDSKLVNALGAFPLPIEIVPFGQMATKRAIRGVLKELGLAEDLAIRCRADGVPLVTDCGHFIVDAKLGRIERVEELATALSGIPGVVEHGLFVGIAACAYIAGPNGVTKITHQEMENV